MIPSLGITPSTDEKDQAGQTFCKDRGPALTTRRESGHQGWGRADVAAALASAGANGRSYRMVFMTSTRAMTYVWLSRTGVFNQLSWVKRHLDARDRIALGIGETNGPIPVHEFIHHFEHQHVQSRVQGDV